jgi:cardiolipin synthase
MKQKKWIDRFLRDAIPGNSVRILKNGSEAFPVMFEAIEKATETINLEFYKIVGDKTGWEFAQLLVRKQEEGCAVRIIYDSIGCIDTEERYFEYLRTGGVRLLEFHPVFPFSGKHWGWWQRDHRKILIVDGKIGFLGGINLTDEYAGTESGGSGWRDTDIMIEGPAVKELQKLFLSTWNQETGELLGGEGFFPHLKSKGNVALTIIGSKERKNRRAIRRAYIQAIKNAEKNIYIANAYFVPDMGIIRALKNARKRGVEVILVLPRKSDVVPVKYASNSLYSRFLRWGVKIYEWQGTVLHAKTAVVDGLWSTIGSFNIDRRSITHNLEVNVAILDMGVGEKMQEMFFEDLKNCKEVLLEDWKKRPLKQKILEKLFYLIRYWL